MEQELEKRKEKFYFFLKQKKDWLVYIILTLIIWLGFHIRTRNIPLLNDITTNKFIPLALDPFVFLRYVKYILENGKLMTIDLMRNYPLGYSNLTDFSLLSHFITYLYKFLHFLNPSVTIEYAHIIYPPVVFIFAIIFFFLLVKKLFNFKIALIASAFLAVLPSFLYRTMAGFSDKEALGTLFMFMTFYFYVSAIKSKKIKTSMLFGLLSGITTGLLGLTWGGVNFVFLTIGATTLIKVFLNMFNKKEVYLYSLYIISSIFILVTFYPARFPLSVFFTSLTTGIVLMTFIIGLLKYFIFKANILKLRDKIQNKFPPGLFSFIIIIIFALIFFIIFYGPSFIITRLNDIIIDLTEPFGRTRWALTVAESHQPYITDWISQFSKTYILGFIIGSIILFYNMIKHFGKKYKWKVTILYSLFILSFIFSRYSPSSTLNGESTLSLILYMGSLIIFILFFIISYIYTFYKKKELNNQFFKLNQTYIFVLSWFLMMIIGARSAIRLIYIFTPITCILVGYLIVEIFKKISIIKNNTYKIIAYIIILVLILNPIGTAIPALQKYDGTLVKFTRTSYYQAKYTGPSYNQQWQYAGQWIRENTPKNATFAHWWDYGYWVQTGGQRATITDGGNAIGAWNYFMGRHVITAQNETESLEFLKSHNATHLLMISDEIGKYPAFSSIGSDENYDRYSWINTFILDTQNIKETRNETVYLYRGSFVLDEDFVYQGKLYPKQGAGIGGVFLPIKTINKEKDNQTITELEFNQPKAILIYGGQQIEIPLSCVFFNNILYEFEGNNLDCCLMIIPKIDGNQGNPLGAALFLSLKVKRTLFTHKYLFGEESDYFKLVYTDEQSMPLAIYNGRLIGPLKIWSINYPENLDIPSYYYSKEVPNPKVYEV